MNRQKVIYKKGDNQNYDYYIIAEKSEIILDEKSLAYKIDPTSKKATYFNIDFAQGNFDYLIEEKTKYGDFTKYIPCENSEIELI